MKKILITISSVLTLVTALSAQVEPEAGKWKTWFISSGKDYRMAAPGSYKNEVDAVLAVQKNTEDAAMQKILYWNAGAPGYRWQTFVMGLWMNDTSYNGALANMLVGVATYDATVAAWDTKYAVNRPRPYIADNRIKLLIPPPLSPSYPCERSVAAGVAVTVISHFYPSMADSVKRLAKELMESRVAAGVAFPADTKAGFELGKKIAELEIAHTKGYTPSVAWDGKMPTAPGHWKGDPMLPLAGKNKTVILDSSSQFRPGPPPDFAKEMEELKKFKPGFRSVANAFLFGSTSFWEDLLNKKMFEYNIHLNPPKAAQIYAITAIGTYDGFAACWDAKYTYWGIRPDQYDTSFRPVLFFTPPFPGYPSGHAVIGSVMAELLSAFFPAEQAYFRKKAKDGAESRFQGGIHIRSDNEVGLEMGKKVGAVIVKRIKSEGMN